MFGAIGAPELMILLFALVLWLVPLVAGIWALVTLHRIRLGQQTIDVRLGTIERLLESRRQ